MLYKWVRDEVKRYSFVTRTEFKKTIFYIYYNIGKKEFCKKLPYRADKKMLLDRIESIKKEIGYYDTRAEKMKKILEEIKNENNTPLIFEVL